MGFSKNIAFVLINLLKYVEHLQINTADIQWDQWELKYGIFGHTINLS